MTTESVLFALLRAAVCGEVLSEEVVAACTPSILSKVYHLAAKHDLAHLAAHALENLTLSENEILKKFKAAKSQAIYRYMRQDFEYHRICNALEQGNIPFIPLKGAVLRELYPELWMRTSVDLDILVHPEDVTRASNILEAALSYKIDGRATHDISLQTPGGAHIELHFDLVEEGRANFAKDVLDKVWETATLRNGSVFWYELPDAWLYFYHIAHMAKHFEVGGCGIRAFLDLWLLESSVAADPSQRRILLEKAGLLQFAQAAVKLSHVWFSGVTPDDLSQKLEQFILQGGTFGSSSNRVALNQQNRGGKLAYLLSRIFIPYGKLKRYYPILETHRWLTPFMQVRRWFMLLKPDVARMAKRELAANKDLTHQEAENVSQLLGEIGLCSSSW